MKSNSTFREITNKRMRMGILLKKMSQTRETPKKMKRNKTKTLNKEVIIIFANVNLEPMLFVDVNLGNSGNKRIVVYEGDTAEGLAENFANENGLDGNMKEKLT